MSILVRPVITEKSMMDAHNSKFTFVVDLSADKVSVGKAVEKEFGVNVLGVATVIVKNKTKRVGKKRTEKVLGK